MRGKRGSPTALGDWLKETCEKQGLSLRQVAARSNLSHGTIADIIKGAHPSPKTIKKLAKCFAGEGYERLAVEDKLLVLAGYRTQRDEGQNLSQPLGRLMDIVSRLSEAQIEVALRFADFLAETDKVSTISRETGATDIHMSGDEYQP